MSPILVRPVREQLEHDRIIRLLQARLKRRGEVAINPGEEQNTPIRIGSTLFFPDLLVTSADRNRRPQEIVEVETTESVNNLEAMAQWANFSKTRIPFHLYVPAGTVDIVRRLCSDKQVDVAEIWTFHTVGDQVRFTQVYRAPVAPEPVKRRPTLRPRSTPAGRRKTPTRAAATRSPRAAKATPVTKSARSQKRK